jgi:hypothetical protein
VELGVAATQVEPVHVGDVGVGERAPGDELGAGPTQEIQILLVVELKRRIARDADPRPGRR